jgi:hypothetical protein
VQREFDAGDPLPAPRVRFPSGQAPLKFSHLARQRTSFNLVGEAHLSGQIDDDCDCENWMLLLLDLSTPQRFHKRHKMSLKKHNKHQIFFLVDAHW